MKKQMKLNLKLILWICFIVYGGSTINAQDSDGDGIINSIDLDDDNDGIPDTEEDNCSPILGATSMGTKGSNTVPLSWSIVTSTPDIVDTTGPISGTWNIGCTGRAPMTPGGHARWVFLSSNTSESFKTSIPGLVIGKTYTFTYHCGRFGGISHTAGQFTVRLGTTVVDQFTPTSGCGWDTRVVTFTASASTQEISFTASGSSNTCANISVSADAIKTSCDFDNDGIINSLDLDSDNDGCFDAYEAGATNVKTDSIIAGPYGTNGLANSKETTADNGLLNYTPVYQYAISSVVVCIDTDGDGVSDVYDIDDDNDGVPDSIECVSNIPLCFDGSFGNTNQWNFVSQGCLNASLGSPDFALPSTWALSGTITESPDGGAFYSAVHSSTSSTHEQGTFRLNNLKNSNMGQSCEF